MSKKPETVQIIIPNTDDDTDVNISQSEKKKKKKRESIETNGSDISHINNHNIHSSQYMNTYTMTKLYTNAPVISACFGKPGDLDRDGVTLITGTTSAPIFHYVDYIFSNDSHDILPEITLAPPIIVNSDNNNSSSSSSKKSNSNHQQNNDESANITILGPFESGSKQLPIIDTTVTQGKPISSSIIPKKRSNSESSQNSINGNKDGDDDNSISSDIENHTNDDISNKKKRNKQGIELTIEQRLEELSNQAQIDQLSLQKQKSTISTTNTNTNSSSILPGTDSLVVLIEQSLQTSDDYLLEQCLQTTDIHLIDTTTKLLSTSKSIDFLFKIITKFEKRPTRVLNLLPWLNCLLQQHATFLTGFPNFAKQFSSLSQILEQRVSCMNKFTALNGRLDLIMHQSFRGNHDTNTTTTMSPPSSSASGPNNNNNNNNNQRSSTSNSKNNHSKDMTTTMEPIAIYNEEQEDDNK